MNAGIEPGRSTLVERAKAIILRPKDEWPKIEAETKSQGAILTGYVLPLAAIGPVATLIGGQVFGFGMFGFAYRPSIVGAVVSAAISFVLSIVMLYIVMLIADFLAPRFNGQANRSNAFKLVAYSWTAAWIAGIFSLIPMLGVFGLLGLYSFYLFYTGAAPMMKVPQDKSVAYTAVTVAIAILLMIVIAPITALIAGAVGFGAANLADRSDAGGTITLPGGKAVDLGEMEKLGKRMEDAASGKAPPVEPAELQKLLPEAIGPFQRTATETVKLGPAGTTAQGTYVAGDRQFRLQVADMNALGALAGLGSIIGVEQTREDADGYERTQTVDGQMQTEAWNRVSSSGKFGKVVANRFLVEADGSAESIDQLKAAVAAIDPDDLADLAE